MSPPSTALPKYYVHDFHVYEHRAHRHLHSFPTRRSSDLREAISVTVLFTYMFAPIMVIIPFYVLMRTLERSEEHTSELQSHHELVCRLLLEKKKQQPDDIGEEQQRPDGADGEVRTGKQAD